MASVDNTDFWFSLLLSVAVDCDGDYNMKMKPKVRNQQRNFSMSETPAPYGTSVDHIHNTVGAAISLMKQALAENDAGLACGAAAELVNAVGDAFMFDALSNGYLPSDPRSTQQEVRDMLRDMAPKTTTSNLWGIVGKMHEKTAAAAH